MVTEGLPIPCSACYEDACGTDGPESSSSTPTSTVQPGASISEALRRLDLDTHRSAPSSTYDQDDPPNKTAIRRATRNSSTSAVDTPPLSPRYEPPSSAAGHGRRESSYRKTYDEITTKRAGPCENCAMTLPKRQGSSSRGSSDTESENGPTLRTRAPYARAYNSSISGASSPPNSNSTASDDDGEGDGSTATRQPYRRRTGTITSTTSRSSTSSSSATIHGHTHYQYYTSTHEPVVPSSFSIVRASCIRTLSFETLPRAATGASPIASPSTPSFVTTPHPAGAAASSGGPIFFGDPSAGYTTAYIFRIPDLQARGHKRVYAFLALSTHRERLAMKTFTFISNAFRELVTWILSLAEAEAERANGGESNLATAHSSVGGGGMYPMSSDMAPAQESGAGMSVADASTTTSGSGFLASGGMGGLSRRMGAGYGYGYGGSGSSTKPKGLPELVGLPDFFLELHQKFVQLLLELGMVLSA